jgi:hypothetical protein
MNSSERTQLVEIYGSAYDILAEAVWRFPREMWQFRANPDTWTIHEILIHIADSEANSYIRCRRFLAEPGSSVLGYDENRWARDLAYHTQNPDDALQLFRLLRKMSYNLIQNQPESIWSRTIHHSENGPMTMDDWLRVYARHIPDHVTQMETVYKIWQASH